MVNKFFYPALVIAVWVLSSSSATYAREDAPLWIGGGNATSDNAFSYLGLITPLGDGKLGQGWFNQSMLSYLTYRYTTSPNGQSVDVKARAPGIATGIGYAWSGQSYGISVLGSIDYRYFDVTPSLPNEKPQGGVYGFSPQLQARYDFSSKFDTDLIAGYTFVQQSSFNRLRFGYKPMWNWRLGAESIYQNGKNYRTVQYGLFATSYLSNGLALEVSGGTAKSQDDTTSPYFGFGVSGRF